MPKIKHAAFDRKWANPLEFEYWTTGMTGKQVARILRMSVGHVYQMRRGDRPIPWWACVVLRAKQMEAARVYKEVTGRNGKPTLVAVRSSRTSPSVVPLSTEQEPAQAAA